MSRFYVMVTDHRMAVAEEKTFEEAEEVRNKLNEFEGYKGKMIIVQEVEEETGKYPFPDLDSIVDEEETHS